MPTKLLYLEDHNALQTNAAVVDVRDEEGRMIVVLDQTVFYPQGGGQPFDTGKITGETGEFVVEEVRFADEVVRHIGTMKSGNLKNGDAVRLDVDAERRRLNSRLHSAGHVVDMAVNALNLGWRPGKGYHFPNGPYVEYEGSLTDTDKETLKAKIEEASNAFVRGGRDTTIVFMEKEKMHEVCAFVPEYLPEGKPGRVVMYGDFGVPCGGTHVNNLSEIGPLVIRKLKQEGANIRVGYGLAE
jgi:Ser-tRNA(Ala) deacylase AlaX